MITECTFRIPLNCWRLNVSIKNFLYLNKQEPEYNYVCAGYWNYRKDSGDIRNLDTFKNNLNKRLNKISSINRSTGIVYLWDMYIDSIKGDTVIRLVTNDDMSLIGFVTLAKDKLMPNIKSIEFEDENMYLKDKYFDIEDTLEIKYNYTLGFKDGHIVNTKDNRKYIVCQNYNDK